MSPVPYLAEPAPTTESVIANLKKKVVAPVQLPAELPTLPDESGAKGVVDLDIGTPDHWIERDERIIRLTGKHPLNCEPPLQTLFDNGFLTPASLFYVRNHGAVPMVENKNIDEWTLTVDGLVARPVTFSVGELKRFFTVVTLPVTLVCAGNRRKEQNVVQKGLGFSWGAAGVSTALFTGVYLSDILKFVKPTPSSDGRRPKHVVFEGIDNLPQGPYGTSQKLSFAKDESKGILISWAMNGLPLTPDHGFPLRVVIPGQIGGRSVKWLNRIEVSDKESQHYLHFFDNKVLPTEVGPAQARAEEHWWYDPKYLISDLNVNSAIAYPAHDEVFSPTPGNDTYTVQGYAYAGGGRRITRVEVTLDDGDTWLLCKIKYPEDTYREIAFDSDVFGKLDLSDRDECYCWCFWSYEVSAENLKNSSAIYVRAMDESLALQQRDMYWSATSMMNNWWFRVAIHAEADGKIRFEHPTMAGTIPGGWMQRMKDEGHDVRRPVFAKAAPAPVVQPSAPTAVNMTNPEISRKITLKELQEHDKPEEPWFAVKGEVYDGTGFLQEHPGGADSITGMAGQDATDDFMAIHSAEAQEQMSKFHIGTLVKEGAVTTTSVSDVSFLSKTQWKKVVLKSIEIASHDSRYYRFALENASQPLGLPIGQHVFVRMIKKTPATIVDGVAVAAQEEVIQRAYTPTSQPNALGEIELLLKLYLPTPTIPGGKMTTLFDKMQVGDNIELKGPLGSFTWLGKGTALWKGKERKVKQIGMICGGSGITPMLQVLRGVFQDKEDTETKVSLIYANKSEIDILCRREIEELLESAGDRYHLHYTLNNPPEVWQYSQGFVNAGMMREHLPAPAEDSLMMICGPPGMINGAKASLTENGWDVPNQLVVF
ncbi:hypothetical protein BDZ94DRAFT_1276612 [Collybia nuda]|uniref:Nitrate reductase n=1 Tax=Collybia nuda TaxID=64659 RepID=A0A9P6CC93_9AGAR|nr:hypothetical protein BDZ94DRAFT_1277267 [Collybia nuda]KAF9456060.1 hypothetical protein BDZ94DRAFT_1276612 [Collybia nuda]